MQGRELEMGALLTLLGEVNETHPRQLVELAYLAQDARGAPTKIAFRMSPFAPGSDRLETDIGILEQDGLIERRQETDGMHPLIRLAWPQPGREREYDLELRDHAEPYRPALQEVGGRYLEADRMDIHLDSAIHFIQSIRGGSDRERVADAVQSMMPRLESRRIRDRYDRMKQLGWLREKSP